MDYDAHTSGSNIAARPNSPLRLPATDADVLRRVIDPALLELPAGLRTNTARLMLVAIGRQESNFAHRTQVGGPAHGLWQFEETGVAGVLNHPRSSAFTSDLCNRHHVDVSATAIYQALAEDDRLAAGIARLLLWTDPRALPVQGHEQAAWDCYLRNWRPGKPARERWTPAYQQACAAVEEVR